MNWVSSHVPGGRGDRDPSCRMRGRCQPVACSGRLGSRPPAAQATGAPPQARTSPSPCARSAHPCAVEFGSPHDPGVRHGADRHLQQEAVVVEDPVLGDDLFACSRTATNSAPSGPRDWSKCAPMSAPAAFAAERFITSACGRRSRPRLFGRLGNEAMTLMLVGDPPVMPAVWQPRGKGRNSGANRARLPPMMASAKRQAGARRAGSRLWCPTNGDPDRQPLLEWPGIDAAVVIEARRLPTR